MRNIAKILTVVVAWFGLTGWALAQQEPIQKPILDPGAEFHYRSDDLLTNTKGASTRTQTVFEFANGIARMEEASTLRPDKRVMTFDVAQQCWEWRMRTGTCEFMRFPLKVGDSWQNKFAEPGDGVMVTRDLSAKFVGWEEIETPAGKFRAARIEQGGRWYRSDGPYSGVLEAVLWYAPEIGRFVKESWVWGRARGGYNSKYDMILTKYQPGTGSVAPLTESAKPKM